jgi:hypothetical protein
LLRGLDFDGLLFTFLDIAQQCMAHFEKRRGDVPMTLRVSRVMLLVASYHDLNQRELGELADFDPATFVGVLDRLESEGWIRRISDPARDIMKVGARANPDRHQSWRSQQPPPRFRRRKIRRQPFPGWHARRGNCMTAGSAGRNGCCATSDSMGLELPKSPGIAASVSPAILRADFAIDSVRRRALIR